MKHFLKIALLWLLMLALPFQSVTAASMLFCKMNTLLSVSSEETSSNKMPCHMTSSMSQDEHSLHIASGMVHEKSAETKNDPGHPLKCKICTSCGLSQAIAPLPPLDFLSISLPHLEQPSLARVDFSGYIPESLERPPLSFHS
jgi:hypothetical protein